MHNAISSWLIYIATHIGPLRRSEVALVSMPTPALSTRPSVDSDFNMRSGCALPHSVAHTYTQLRVYMIRKERARTPKYVILRTHAIGLAPVYSLPTVATGRLCAHIITHTQSAVNSDISPGEGQNIIFSTIDSWEIICGTTIPADKARLFQFYPCIAPLLLG